VPERNALHILLPRNWAAPSMLPCLSPLLTRGPPLLLCPRAVELVLATEEHVQRLFLAVLAEEPYQGGLSEVGGERVPSARATLAVHADDCALQHMLESPLLAPLCATQADVINGLALLALLCNSVYGERGVGIIHTHDTHCLQCCAGW